MFSVKMNDLDEEWNSPVWSSLPDEILLNVFGNLTQNELGRISRVCRRWNVLTKIPNFWKKVDVELYDPCGSQTKAAVKLVKKLPSCATHIRLDFRHRSDWSEPLNFKELCVRLKRCPHLQMLFLRASRLSDNLQSIIDLCAQFLQTVKVLVFHYSVFPHCLVEKKRKKACMEISKIETLDLNTCELGPVNKPPFSRMLHLRKLRLGLTYVSDSWFSDVNFHRNPVEVLDLGTWLSCRLLQVIRTHMLHLKELYICGSHVENNDFCFSGHAFPYLEKICLNDCCRLTWVAIVSLIMSCPYLQHIYVKKTVLQTFPSLPFFVKNKCKLEMIKVAHCYDHRKIDYLCE